MKKLLLSVCAFSLTLATLQAGEITKYVNPFIGTGAIDGGLSGNNYPGATSPFGMIQLSPDTSEAPNWGDASGYDYNRNTIFGFSHTRLSGTGASDRHYIDADQQRTHFFRIHARRRESPSRLLSGNAER